MPAPAKPVILANGTALAPIGSAAESSLPINKAVALSLQSTTGYSSFAWVLIGKPEGSVAALTSTSGFTSAFTPDLAGEYQIKGTATGADGSSSSRVSIVIVRTKLRSIRKVSAKRSADLASDIDTLKARFNELADVADALTNEPENYGAVGDDPTHNDGPGIQAAITAAATLGVPVVFRPKTYYLLAPQTTITVPSKARLILNGARLLVSAVAGQACIGLKLLNVSDVEIRGGIVEGTLGGAVPSSGYGIYVDGATNVRLTDLELLNHYFDGVLIANASSRVVQRRVNAHHNRRAGCSVIGGTRLSFVDSAYNDSGYAASPEGAASGVNVESETGGSVDDLAFENCEFARNGVAANSTGMGLVVRKGVTGTRPRTVKVSRCRFKSNVLVGMIAATTDGVVVSDCYASGHNGAVVGGANQYAYGANDATDVHFLGNRGDDNSRLIFVAGCDGGVIANNHGRGRAASVMGDDYDGITVRNQGAPTNATNRAIRVANNTVIGFGGHGIIVSHASSAEVVSNTSKDNGQCGVQITASPSAVVARNHVSGNSRQAATTYYDVRVGAGCHQASILDNVCRYHEKYTTGTVQAAYNRDFVILDPATTNASLIADWFVGAPLELTGGTGSNQRRTINTYNAGTRRADIDALVTIPDGTTTYAIRWQHIVGGSVRVDAGSTGVRVLGNDVRDAAAISDEGTATVKAQTLGAAAADLASVIALANAMRTALINTGIGT